MSGFAALCGNTTGNPGWAPIFPLPTGSKKKWGDDLTKIPVFGISTVFSDGKKFNWYLAAACLGRGLEEKIGNKAQGGAFRRHKDLTELGMAKSWNPSGLTSMIPVTSPWNPELPLQHNQSPHTGLCSGLSTGISAEDRLPHGGERKVWAQEKLFHLKSAKSQWHPTGKNVEEELTSQHQLCSTAQPSPGEPSWPLTRDLKGSHSKVYDEKGFRSYTK